MPAGAVDVELTNNHHDYTSDGTVFTFMSSRVLGMNPAEGPVAGGTEVQIQAAHLDVTDDVYCTFSFAARQGAILVHATFLSMGLVACATPRHPSPQLVELARELPAAVHLTVHEAHVFSTLSFVYVNPAHALGVVPRSGPADGGTTITVRGHGFVQSPPHYCLFAGSNAPAQSRWTVVLARFLSTTTIECISPSLRALHGINASSGVFSASLGVAEGSWAMQHEHASSLRYTYYPPLHVTRLLPSHGPLR
jgi:hypothetical protein